ncbi:stage III sporulation protein AG [Clostridium polynesiense]|uniref:stage III sporulation protein AG n=1 Tax=Clostridium polynesiense TaxID=1325933 RepID=UPI0005901764|nr:stage III sporulation protein AG [Clostridium polynesiense]
MNIGKLKDILKLDNKKFSWNYLIIILLLILFYIVIDTFGSGGDAKVNAVKSEEVKTANYVSSYEQNQKNDLKYILTQMDGVGRVDVMLYFQSGEEQVPAIDINKSENHTEEMDNEGGKRTSNQNNDGSKVVMSNSGMKNEPFVLKTNKPKLSGVVIVAEGAGDEVVKFNIEKAVSKLYNIELDKVYVYPMKK